jgi:hypothetical protein
MSLASIDVKIMSILNKLINLSRTGIKFNSDTRNTQGEYYSRTSRLARYFHTTYPGRFF